MEQIVLDRNTTAKAKSPIGPPPFILVEPDIIQPAQSPKKLSWPEIKLVINLRDAAGEHEGKQNVVLRSPERLKAAAGFKSNGKFKAAIHKLKSWPSRRRSVIEKIDRKTGEIQLRDISHLATKRHHQKGVKFIKVYRWFWYSQAPDSLKSMVLFARTNFERKDKEGEIFSLPIKNGVLRHCFLAGTHSRQRTKMASEMVSLGETSGLFTVVARSTSNRAMVLRLNDSTRTKTASEAFAKFRGHQQEQVGAPTRTKKGTTKKSSRAPAPASEGTTLQSPFSESTKQNPSQIPPQTRGREAEPKQGEVNLKEENKAVIEEVESFLDFSQVPWGETKRNPESFLPALEALLEEARAIINEVPEKFRPCLASVLFQAISSDNFKGLKSLSWGFLLSKAFLSRFSDSVGSALSEALEPFRLQEERKKKAEEALAADSGSPDPTVRRAAFEKVKAADPGSAVKIMAVETDTELALEMGRSLVSHFALMEKRICPGLGKAIKRVAGLPGAKGCEGWWLFAYAVRAYSKLQQQQHTKPESDNDRQAQD